MTLLDIPSGTTITRAELNAKYGGGIQGGMLTPAGGELIFLFSDLESGERYGYSTDGWADKSYSRYFYTGEGAEGHQVVYRRRNKALLDSVEDGREVHLFLAVGKVEGSDAKLHEYLGQFEVDPIEPWRPVTTLDQNKEPRTAVLFNLNRVTGDGPPRFIEAKVAEVLETSSSTVVSREASNNVSYARKAVDPGNVQRRERVFEDEVIAWLERAGHETARIRIDIPGELGPLFTDTWVEETGTLYEAKADATRNDVRMAIAQLLDYRRHISPAPKRCVVVVPIRPSADLVSLIRECGLELAVYDINGLNQVERP